jgi:hypothetical protein
MNKTRQQCPRSELLFELRPGWHMRILKEAVPGQTIAE